MTSEAQSQHAAGLRRATYYLRRDQIRSLKVCAALKGRQLSDVMREAVDRYVRACVPTKLRRYWNRSGVTNPSTSEMR
jgi:hypothetical protein